MVSALTAPVSAVAEDSPAFAYLLHCSGCHLENGAGDPPIVPDLRVGLGLLLDKAEGRSYMLRVPGVTDPPVSAQQMTGLLNWLIGTLLYPDRIDFIPFTPDEITAGRENRLSDPLKYRQALFARLRAGSVTAAK